MKLVSIIFKILSVPKSYHSCHLPSQNLSVLCCTVYWIKQPPAPQQTRTWKIGSRCNVSLSFPTATTPLLLANVLLTSDYPQFFGVPVVARAVSSTKNTLCLSSPFGHIPSQSQLSYRIVLVFSISGNPSGFYLSKLRAATTVFCLLHVVILKCSKHSVSINLLWIDIKYVYKISNPIILGSPGLDYEPLGDGCHFFSLTWSLGKGKADNKCLLD